MRASLHTLYCIDANCDGAHGVNVEWIEATEWEPGEWSRDTCHCGHPLSEASPTTLLAAHIGETLLGIWTNRRNS